MKLRSTPKHITIHYNPVAKTYTVVKAVGSGLPKSGAQVEEPDIQQLIDEGAMVTLH